MSPAFSSPANSSLASVAMQLCEELGGYWSGAKGMARCPAHDDRTPSLGVSLGRRAILFHCFAGCSQDQVLTALAARGVSPASMFSGNVEADAGVSVGNPAYHAFAERIWREARPIDDTPAKAYLQARGIRALSRALRFHPRTPLGPKGSTQYLPALIAAVTMDHGLVGIHRTFLNLGRPAVAPFDNPKRALGSLAAGAVRLFDPVDGRLGLAEGVESALAAKALTQIPCWASLGNERLCLSPRACASCTCSSTMMQVAISPRNAREVPTSVKAARLSRVARAPTEQTGTTHCRLGCNPSFERERGEKAFGLMKPGKRTGLRQEVPNAQFCSRPFASPAI